jgi:3D (Asp-Asp-Asp) domain-containing protein
MEARVMTIRSRLWIVPAIAVMALPSLLGAPPATAQEAAWRQLRLAAAGPAKPMRAGSVVAAQRYQRLQPGQTVQRQSTLYRDQRRVLAAGREGIVVHRTPARVGRDSLLRRLPESRALRSRPVPAKVAVGTMPVHYLVRGGVTYRYMRRIRLVATAYNASYAQNGPWGATAAWNGMPLVRGMVAVDPSVIPLGTRLYVDGYGPALAADTGSAIVGDRIDLYFDRSAQQTANFGIKTLNVYVLGPASA